MSAVGDVPDEDGMLVGEALAAIHDYSGGKTMLLGALFVAANEIYNRGHPHVTKSLVERLHVAAFGYPR